LCRYLDGCPSG